MHILKFISIRFYSQKLNLTTIEARFNIISATTKRLQIPAATNEYKSFIQFDGDLGGRSLLLVAAGETIGAVWLKESPGVIYTAQTGA